MRRSFYRFLNKTVIHWIRLHKPFHGYKLLHTSESYLEFEGIIIFVFVKFMGAETKSTKQLKSHLSLGMENILVK